ncbi:unnamed protein product [Cylindrotheca closterium]|uniref:5'-nucleotidase n=1 Tax=Cylindrotheca closterium TaxID=2856 RepID=A0AAD2PXM5_9STRA|nr:unnamed protein product [Cylindrotheca closterium]
MPRRPSILSPPTSPMMSSYEVDSDEDAEQRMGEGNPARTIPESVVVRKQANGGASNRYADVLASVGLDGKLNQADSLPKERIVSSYDIFCNRELKQEAITAIGFDMDYTLVQYKQPAFDELAFNGAKEKLVNSLGYPKEVLDFEYDHKSWQRGLIIDTERGNVLKIDRHKYVRVAYHGFEEISSSTRKILYARNFNKVESFSEKSYVNMDTLFQFVDVHLFALLVEMKDGGEHEMLDFKTYGEIYKQIRQSVDLCHRDGVIKDEVARYPDKYIVDDKGMIPMLKRYKEQGVKLFLLTNSFWEYTSTAMNYLYHGKRINDEEQKKNEWIELFDLVIAGSCKPAFMLDPYLQLFRVNMQDGSLKNTDGVFEIDALGPDGATKFLEQGKIFQGGNWQHLHKMLGVKSGDEILYVGDHLYSDVLRSKRTLGWRSLFIMPELDDELRVFAAELPLRNKISKLRELREELELKAEFIRRTEDMNDASVKAKLAEFEADDDAIKEVLTTLAEKWHSAFHPVWGAMFNAGYQESRFAFYVENYACLYTSKASNMGLSSPTRSFRTTMDIVPHDQLLEAANTKFDDTNPW